MRMFQVRYIYRSTWQEIILAFWRGPDCLVTCILTYEGNGCQLTAKTFTAVLCVPCIDQKRTGRGEQES